MIYFLCNAELHLLPVCAVLIGVDRVPGRSPRHSIGLQLRLGSRSQFTSVSKQVCSDLSFLSRSRRIFPVVARALRRTLPLPALRIQNRRQSGRVLQRAGLGWVCPSPTSRDHRTASPPAAVLCIAHHPCIGPKKLTFFRVPRPLLAFSRDSAEPGGILPFMDRPPSQDFDRSKRPKDTERNTSR